jgi:hypothetical protein
MHDGVTSIFLILLFYSGDTMSCRAVDDGLSSGTGYCNYSRKLLKVLGYQHLHNPPNKHPYNLSHHQLLGLKIPAPPLIQQQKHHSRQLWTPSPFVLEISLVY